MSDIDQRASDATRRKLESRFRHEPTLIDVQVHYCTAGSERRRLPAVPVVGAYLFGPGGERRLWQVDAVVFDGKAVAVYGVELSARLASELIIIWATWGEPEQTNQLTN